MIPKSDSPLSLEERRARKEARREAQREANVGRAAKMHEARLESAKLGFEHVPPVLNVGCSGWFYWHWRGLFYPEQMPTKDWFGHYSKSFSTVELNAPFYSWPTVAAVKGWLRQARTGDFIYTVKVCELITHLKRFTGTKTLVKDFGYIADLLGERMGCFLFQLPPSYHFTASRLDHILSQLDPTLRNVVEFRHASWWNDSVFTAFKKAGAIFCYCSAPRLPEQLVHTTDEVYIRFHGKDKWYQHDYTSEELERWVSWIKESGCKRVWAYFNNDRDAFAIKNARAFLKTLHAAKIG